MKFETMPGLKDIRQQLRKHTHKNYAKQNLSRIQFITLHHSGTTSGDAFSFVDYHVRHHGWPGIGYHFVITKTGIVQWTNSLETVSYHTGGRNSGNIGICLTGAGEFTSSQFEAMNRLLVLLTGQFQIPVRNVLGHNEHPGQQTICPGMNMAAVRTGLYQQKSRSTATENSKNEQASTILKEFNGIFRRGMKGAKIRDLQNLLVLAGERLPKYGDDGIYGLETEAAVRSFQRKHGLSNDGIAGPKTLTMLARIIGQSTPF
ncbi:N-acetylmuramoyl-L-alanine amidase [Evansella sp. LMS18]|uniref:peptidoglycan recognition protein family protein n=1 Tax=Evansella sp. LMS18 TaxID=2924033 RepID=UPI0020D00178|nr:N-acetylmuramoyl-L-alanine amidase [Evansella sp. LMS18]UTR09111.1 N-acetylmuramoyl-L-alanine amidase [Evansella sp. LMS18]